ncbi:Ribonuclease E/G-like protein, chloroplastic [Linum grandiflorum]
MAAAIEYHQLQFPPEKFMEVSEACSRFTHHRTLPLRTLPCFLASQKPFSPCTWLSLENALKVRLRSSSRSRSCFRIPVKSAKKGGLCIPLEGLCEVDWTIEADLRDGQILYLGGEHTSLGCWQTDKAIQMCPTEDTNLWRAQVKMPCGVNVKYNYFLKRETSKSSDIKWRTGPEFSVSVPSNGKQDRKVLVRDSWMRKKNDNPAMASSQGWDTWIEDAHVTARPLPSDQPVEEPWLVQSATVFVVGDEKSIPKTSGSIEDDFSNLVSANYNCKAIVKVPPVNGSSLISKKDLVSTMILINSSVCTMQRIAVLEDGKLVELLLEPVKTNVQCDSVYLGTVTKLAPHMGGAFVQIGSQRSAFMGIHQNRGPFIFPPFRRRNNKGEENGSVLEALEEEQSAVTENEHSLPDLKAIDGIVEFISQDELVNDEEQDLDDDFDTSEEKVNMNGSVVDHRELEAQFGKFLDLKNHLQAETTGGTFGSSISPLHDPSYTSRNGNKWSQVRSGTKIIVQVVKEGLGTKGPSVTAYPSLRSRFWILSTCCERIGVSKKLSEFERSRLRVIAKTLKPPGFGVTVRTAAAGNSLEELQKDLQSLLATWKDIVESAKSAALAADEGVEGAIPVILHRAKGQTLSVVQDYFNDKVHKMVVDSPRTYHEVTNYLQDIAPHLCNRVQLHDKRIPLFDEFCIEEEIDNMLSKRVQLSNGGSLVIEQTEALVSIDVNGGQVMLGKRTSQEKAVLEVNLAAAKQIARELRLRDIGGIIVVDFIDMEDASNKKLVYEEMKRAVERDRSVVNVFELSRHGLMEITRKRVRPSVTFMISEPCSCCQATGRVVALETSFSKIEQQICRLLVMMETKADPENPKTWPRFILRVDQHMSDYLTSGRKTRLAILSSSLKVWILLKVARDFTRGLFEVKPLTDETTTDSSKSQHQIAIQVIRRAEARTNNSGRNLTVFPVKKRNTTKK